MIVFDFQKTFEGTKGHTPAVSLSLTGEVSQTAITAVIGPSGSGKTSLAMMMAGLLKAETGYFAVGQTVFEDTRAGATRFDCRFDSHFEPPERRGIGFVFQNHRLFPYQTVRQNILFAVRHGGRASPIDFETAVGLLHLEPLLQRLPSTLSGGQAQRLALARTLAHPRPVLVLDDPFSALDRSTEDTVFANLQEYAKDKAVFLISHRLYHFPQMQRVIFMEDGKTTVGTHEELLAAVPAYRQLYESQTGGQQHENEQ